MLDPNQALEMLCTVRLITKSGSLSLLISSDLWLSLPESIERSALLLATALLTSLVIERLVLLALSCEV